MQVQRLVITLTKSSKSVTDLLGPIIGSFITESHLGWRWTAWIILILAAAVGIPSFILVPETYAPVLKHRTAKNKGIEVQEGVAFKGFVTKYLSRPMMMLAYEPMVRFLSPPIFTADKSSA